MEAASAVSSFSARLRAGSFERECEQLRPLGEAYLVRRFGGSLNRADAEDAVAEVLIRLHRNAAAGRLPENLRAAFFTSVRNAGIDQLRTRASRPTVGLEVAADAPAPGAAPPERAERQEDAARLQEALGRMRGNYREAILLRFGLGMTVPEIATHIGISLPAAKKLVLRATAQARKRMAAIDDAEFCPEMRDLARRSVLERHLSALASEEETKVLHAHFSHCGSCKSFLANLHDSMHELGTAAVFGLGAGDRLGVHLGLLDHLGRWAGGALDGVQAGAGRLRHLAFKTTGALSGSDGGPASAVMSTSQKIAAVCTAGAATTATCLLTGAVGPGLGAPAPPVDAHPQPAAHVRQFLEHPEAPVYEPAPVQAPAEGPSQSSPEHTPDPPAASSPSESPAPAPATPVPSDEPTPAPSEFGVESSPPPSPAPGAVAAPPATRAPEGSSGGEFGGGGTTPAPKGGSGSGVGFQG
jgi:RNA polymerase sigma factor (sigma-70 family)